MGLRKGTPDPMAKKRSIYHEIGECSRMYTRFPTVSTMIFFRGLCLNSEELVCINSFSINCYLIYFFIK